MTDRAPDALPTGAEVFASICETLDVQQLSPTSFVAGSLPHFNQRIYGGQVYAQAVIAGARTVPQGRYAHSVHGYFLRPGNPDLPIELQVEELHDGRSFSARRTHALQDGVPILTLTASFQEVQEGVEHELVAPPTVPGPEELVSSDTVFRSPDAPHLTRMFLAPKTAFDIRHVEGELYTAPGPERSLEQSTWVRAHGDLPHWADRNVRAALLAYACDQIMLEPAMRGHDLYWLTPGISIASIDHAMWWHRDLDVTQWMLFVQASPSAGGGRAMGTIRVYDRAGRLLATSAQEGVFRVRPGVEPTGISGP